MADLRAASKVVLKKVYGHSDGAKLITALSGTADISSLFGREMRSRPNFASEGISRRSTIKRA